MTLLQLSRLGVSYRRQPEPALDGINLTLAEGERLAILGESGSGKSTLALTVAELLPPDSTVRGDILWSGFTASPKPGRDIGFVFQDPAGSLDPLIRVGEQVAEVIRAHRSIDRDAALEAAIALLAQVKLPEPQSFARAYPYQLSGGQKQRVAIACAISANPKLLIADEPTSSLDTIMQAEILALLTGLVSERSMSLLLITHDIAVAARNADRIAVLQNGKLVEIGAAAQLIRKPRSYYTRQLVSSHIALDATPRVSFTP
jgi:peptide/nickel transport system ATP-binding protein